MKHKVALSDLRIRTDVRQRIKVVAVGDPESPLTWSGTPAGLLKGLREARPDADVCGIDAIPDRRTIGLAMARFMARHARQVVRAAGAENALTFAKGALMYSPEWSETLARVVVERIAAAGGADVVIQAGDGLYSPHPKSVLYTDMTACQRSATRIFEPAGLEFLDHARQRASEAGYRQFAALTFSTAWARDSMVRDHGLPADRCFDVGIGSDYEAAAHVERPMKPTRFLFVGSPWERKNGPTVLAAFLEVLGDLGSATLDIVGSAPQVSHPCVTVHGVLARTSLAEQKKLASLYARSHCLVVPGAFEAAGRVFIEASRSGLLAIGSQNGGALDLIGPFGEVVPPGNVAALAEAMGRQARRWTPELARSAIERSRWFTWGAVAERILAAASA